MKWLSLLITLHNVQNQDINHIFLQQCGMQIFGLMWQHNYLSRHERILEYVGDMNIVEFQYDSAFDSDDTTLPNYYLTTSLDHTGHLARKIPCPNRV